MEWTKLKEVEMTTNKLLNAANCEMKAVVADVRFTQPADIE
jgi:hypothetical protein